MANEYKVAAGAVGAHAKTLAANQIDTIAFADAIREVEVYTDGAAALYFTIDGSDPTVGGADTFFLPVAQATRVVRFRDKRSVVKLISAGTPTYSVSRLGD